MTHCQRLVTIDPSRQQLQSCHSVDKLSNHLAVQSLIRSEQFTKGSPYFVDLVTFKETDGSYVLAPAICICVFIAFGFTIVGLLSENVGLG